MLRLSNRVKNTCCQIDKKAKFGLRIHFYYLFENLNQCFCMFMSSRLNQYRTSNLCQARFLPVGIGSTLLCIQQQIVKPCIRKKPRALCFLREWSRHCFNSLYSLRHLGICVAHILSNLYFKVQNRIRQTMQFSYHFLLLSTKCFISMDDTA